MILNGPQRWAEKYMNIPFMDKGFSFAGCHCWGLVWLVFKHELNIELDKYLEFSALDLRNVHKSISASKALDPWIPIEGEVQPFDVVPMTVFDQENNRVSMLEGHVGVAASSGYVLHIEEGIHSTCMPFNNPWISRRMVLGAYRHKHFVKAVA